MIKKIDDIVNEMSEQEKEKFSDLILECKQRENDLNGLNTIDTFNEFISKLFLKNIPDKNFFKE